MDRRLLDLERAFAEDPADGDVALALGRACLRAARPLRALTVTRGAGVVDVRLDAAREVARRLGAPFLDVGPLGFERFGAADDPGVLVPGGAFLEDGRDGASARRSALLPGARRADLRRVSVPDVVIAERPGAPPGPRAAAAAWARARGARLPAAAEWKKALRGGCFLDGDETATTPNPEPDRIAPWGSAAPAAAGALGSPYGAWFDPAVPEWAADLTDHLLVLDLPNGRYTAPVGGGLRRLAGSGRWVLEVPRDP